LVLSYIIRLNHYLIKRIVCIHRQAKGIRELYMMLEGALIQGDIDI